jgi:hypothetical protein
LFFQKVSEFPDLVQKIAKMPGFHPKSGKNSKISSKKWQEIQDLAQKLA